MRRPLIFGARPRARAIPTTATITAKQPPSHNGVPWLEIRVELARRGGPLTTSSVWLAAGTGLEARAGESADEAAGAGGGATSTIEACGADGAAEGAGSAALGLTNAGRATTSAGLELPEEGCGGGVTGLAADVSSFVGPAVGVDAFPEPTGRFGCGVSVSVAQPTRNSKQHPAADDSNQTRAGRERSVFTRPLSSRAIATVSIFWPLSCLRPGKQLPVSLPTGQQPSMSRLRASSADLPCS